MKILLSLDFELLKITYVNFKVTRVDKIIIKQWLQHIIKNNLNKIVLLIGTPKRKLNMMIELIYNFV